MRGKSVDFRNHLLRMKTKALPRRKMMNQAGVTKTVAVAVVVTTMVMLELNLSTMILLPMLTSSIKMLELLLYNHCEKFVNSWVVMPFLNNCVVNLNMCRSCKVGLCKM
jgi:hypothetical protein